MLKSRAKAYTTCQTTHQTCLNRLRTCTEPQILTRTRVHKCSFFAPTQLTLQAQLTLLLRVGKALGEAVRRPGALGILFGHLRVDARRAVEHLGLLPLERSWRLRR